MKLRTVCIFLCLLLLVGFAACNPSKQTDDSTTPKTDSATGATEIGEGSRSFRVDVTDKDGKTVSYLVHTNELYVAQALADVGLITCDFLSFGVLIKSANGIPVDFETDKAFWGFYIDGVFADESHRIDQEEITDNSNVVYSLRWTTA